MTLTSDSHGSKSARSVARDATSELRGLNQITVVIMADMIMVVTIMVVTTTLSHPATRIMADQVVVDVEISLPMQKLALHASIKITRMSSIATPDPAAQDQIRTHLATSLNSHPTCRRERREKIEDGLRALDQRLAPRVLSRRGALRVVRCGRVSSILSHHPLGAVVIIDHEVNR
jgi:hypothetical protein